MAALARDEIDALTSTTDALVEQIKLLLLPRDPLDDKNIMLEVSEGRFCISITAQCHVMSSFDCRAGRASEIIWFLAHLLAAPVHVQPDTA